MSVFTKIRSPKNNYFNNNDTVSINEKPAVSEEVLTEDQIQLLNAASKGDISKINSLISAEINVNVVDNENNTPLMRACGAGHLEACKTLVNANAEIEALGEKGGTCLMFASANVHLLIVNWLLGLNVDIDKKDNNGNTALWYSVEHGHEEIMNVLLSEGAEFAFKPTDGMIDIMIYAANNHLRATAACIEQGDDPSAEDEEIVDLLLEFGAEPEYQNSFGTALMLAIESGYLNMVKLLVRAGVNVNAQNQEGKTALSKARGRGHEDLAEVLLEAGAT